MLFLCRLRSGRPPGKAQFRFQNPNDRERKGNPMSLVFYDSAPSERSPAKGILKIFGQPSRLSRDCQRQPPEKLRFRRSRNTQDYCLGAFGTINGTKASARISPCGARSGSSQRDTVIFIRYFPGFTPSSGTRTVAVSRGGMSGRTDSLGDDTLRSGHDLVADPEIFQVGDPESVMDRHIPRRRTRRDRRGVFRRRAAS